MIELTPALRTAFEALITANDTGKLGAMEPICGCEYHDDAGRNCAIGSLLSPAAHALIDELGLNVGVNASEFWERAGAEPIAAELEALGLDPSTADTLQRWHDRAYQSSWGNSNTPLSPAEFSEVLQLALDGYSLNTRPGGHSA